MSYKMNRLVGMYGLRVAVLLALVVIFLLTSTAFRGTSTLYSIMEQFAFVGLVGLGVAVTMIVGELDLSVASMAAFMGVIAIHFAQYGLVVAILAGTIGGAVLGLIQGILISKLGLNSLVLTVGTLILLRGGAYLASGGQPIMVDNFEMTDPLHERWGVLSPMSLLAIIIFIGIGAFLTWTRPGRNLYAVGGARNEARAAGVPVGRSLNLAFMLSGALAGLAGSIACLKGGSAAPESFHDLLLLAAGAAMIGGISLAGGAGTVWNVVLGVLITGVLAVGMSSVAAPAYFSSLLLGVLLVGILVADAVAGKIRRQRRLKMSKPVVSVQA